MEILDHTDAQALLADTELSAAAVRSGAQHLEAFVARYLPLFPRQEHRDHARTVLEGKLTGLQRKTTEPIATQAGQKRRPCSCSSVLAAGRTTPSWPSCVVTSPRSWPKRTASGSWTAPASPRKGRSRAA